MGKTNPSAEARDKRQKRVRRKVRGTAERPRLCIFRSSRHMYAQVIDDDSGCTLVTASTLSPNVRDRVKDVDKKEAAKLVGRAVAEAAKAKGIDKVVYDRNGFLYHGRVAALAESAREAGLDF